MLFTALRAHTIMPTGKTKRSRSSLAAMKSKAKMPENTEVIEIDDSDDEDTKEQSSVKEDSIEDIQEDRKPAAKDPKLVAIDSLHNELEEVFNRLLIKAKRKTTLAYESPAAKKRKISDASERSLQLKAPPVAMVTPTQGDACREVLADESCAECVETELETKHTLEATSDSNNENSNFEVLLKTAGEEQQRLQAAANGDDTEAAAVHGEDLVDRGTPETASQVDGTPHGAADIWALEESEDPNCLAVEQAAAACSEVDSAGESNTKPAEDVEHAHPDEESDSDAENEVEVVVFDEFPEELDEPEEEEVFVNEYDEAETWDSPINASISTMIQGIKDILPPSFGSFFLFVCGLSCIYVDRLAAAKLALCLLFFCFNVGNSVVEAESGDQPVFCVSLPKNPSKSWRALVLSICMVGSMAVINVITNLGDKVTKRFQIKAH